MARGPPQPDSPKQTWVLRSRWELLGQEGTTVRKCPGLGANRWQETPSPPRCPCCHKPLQNSWGDRHRVPDSGKDTPHTPIGTDPGASRLQRKVPTWPHVACPSSKVWESRKPHRSLPRPVHPGGRLHQATVSGFLQDVKCHAAGPPALVTPGGRWDLNPRIRVLSPAGGRSAQEDGEWGLDRNGPVSPGIRYHSLETLS